MTTPNKISEAQLPEDATYRIEVETNRLAILHSSKNILFWYGDDGDIKAGRSVDLGREHYWAKAGKQITRAEAIAHLRAKGWLADEPVKAAPVFKVGDRVRVARKANQEGCPQYLDNFVGEIGTIKKTESIGVTVDFVRTARLFPPDVLAPAPHGGPHDAEADKWAANFNYRVKRWGVVVPGDLWIRDDTDTWGVWDSAFAGLDGDGKPRYIVEKMPLAPLPAEPLAAWVPKVGDTVWFDNVAGANVVTALGKSMAIVVDGKGEEYPCDIASMKQRPPAPKVKRWEGAATVQVKDDFDQNIEVPLLSRDGAVELDRETIGHDWAMAWLTSTTLNDDWSGAICAIKERLSKEHAARLAEIRGDAASA